MAFRVVGLLGWLALFYVVLVANVVLHELGHALMSRIVRFRIEHIVAGPFVLWWERGRARLQFTGSFSHLLGGHVAVFPLRLSPRLRGAIIAVLAAGPAVSFLSMVSAFTVFLATEPTPQEPGFVGTVLLMSVGVCAVQLLYGVFSGDDSRQQADGTQILGLLKKSSLAWDGWRGNVLVGALVEGRREPELDRLASEIATIPPQSAAEIHHWIAVIYLLAQGERAAADEFVRRVEEPSGRELRRRMEQDLIAYHVLVSGNDARARALEELLDGERDKARASIAEWKAAAVAAYDGSFLCAYRQWVLAGFRARCGDGESRENTATGS